jgi:hypothetical protein
MLIRLNVKCVANDGFVTILKQMTVASMPAVVKDGMACKDAPHKVGDTTGSATQEQMRMIAHQCPGKNRRVGFGGNQTQTRSEILTVQIIINDVAPFDTAHNDVMQSSEVSSRAPRGICFIL